MVISSRLNNYRRNQLFAKTKQPYLPFLMAIVFALVMMVVDSQTPFLAAVRYALSVALSPLYYVVDAPARVQTWAVSALRAKKDLLQDNEQLRQQDMLSQAKLLQWAALERENKQLRAFFASPARERTQVTVAQVLAVSTANTRQLLILNKGTRDKVFVGQPVLDEQGVMGQIIDVGYMTSTLLLIADSQCAVPVRNQRTEERAILVGTNRLDQLSLINLPKTSLIKTGDLLVTSGLGRLYPEGYPVGTVMQVHNKPGDAFVTVDVQPVAALKKSHLVLLLWPEKEHAVYTAQINERLQSMDTKV